MALIDFSKLNIKLSNREIADEMVKFLTSKIGWEHKPITFYECDIREEAVWKRDSSYIATLITNDPEMITLFQAAKKIASL